jgi:Ca-activated chloride channel homolog
MMNMNAARPERVARMTGVVETVAMSLAVALGWLIALLATPALVGCGKDSSPPEPRQAGAPSGDSGSSAKSARAKQRPKPSGETIDLIFPYGSEKKLWLEQVTDAFNSENRTIGSGKMVVVEPRAMGSGESVEEILSGRIEAHLVSPASSAFIKLGNARSQAQTGGPLVGATQDLVLSPVVIAMWKPMAEAIGWGKKPIGWGEILQLTKSPDGWTSYGFAQWGSFRFGHTHPEYSNSGLMAIIAQAYWGAGKVAGLTGEDLANPAVAESMSGIQRSIVHYGDSTGFFGRKLFAGGPEYLAAAVLYENVVIESYDRSKYDTSFPVVAVYPKEGTFWSEHPVGVIERPWVTPEHQEAARMYIAYLLERPRQEAAMAFGFRPSDVTIPLASPLDAAHGIDPTEPKTVLETPSADVIAGVLDLWRVNKKHSHVALVLDTSGSMKKDQRIKYARDGASQLIEMLGEEDMFSFMPFSSRPTWAQQGVKIKDSREKARQTAMSVLAEGGTALYDSVSQAFDYLQGRKERDTITAIVVLTDGQDTDSKMSLQALLEKVKSDEETKSVRIFTIRYGNEASKDALQKIADETQGKYFEGTPENVRQVFKEIATFF